jgi:hypothetical protein
MSIKSVPEPETVKDPILEPTFGEFTKFDRLKSEIVSFIVIPAKQEQKMKAVKILEKLAKRNSKSFKKETWPKKPNLKYFSKENRTILDNVDRNVSNMSRSKSVMHFSQVEVSDSIEDLDTKLVRSNSSDALLYFGQNPILKHPINYNGDYSDSDRNDSDDSDLSEATPYAKNEFKLPKSKRLNTPKILLGNTDKAKLELKTAEELVNNVDDNKKAVSIEEVIELTLLHAQQMHILQDEYESQLNSAKVTNHTYRIEMEENALKMQHNFNMMQEENQRLSLEISQMNEQIEALNLKLTERGKTPAAKNTLKKSDVANSPKIAQEEIKSNVNDQMTVLEVNEKPYKRVIQNESKNTILPPIKPPAFSSPVFEMNVRYSKQVLRETKVEHRKQLEKTA